MVGIVDLAIGLTMLVTWLGVRWMYRRIILQILVDWHQSLMPDQYKSSAVKLPADFTSKPFETAARLEMIDAFVDACHKKMDQ